LREARSARGAWRRVRRAGAAPSPASTHTHFFEVRGCLGVPLRRAGPPHPAPPPRRPRSRHVVSFARTSSNAAHANLTHANLTHANLNHSNLAMVRPVGRSVSGG